MDKKKYLPAIKKAWIGLNTLVRADGKVGWTQPIGAGPRRNFNAESWEVYGAGAYLHGRLRSDQTKSLNGVRILPNVKSRADHSSGH